MNDAGPKADIGSDAMARARAAMAVEMPKRFYERVEVADTGGGFRVLLDGRPAKTPAKIPYLLPDKGLAMDIAGEWDAQKEHIVSPEMPLTRLINSAIDNVKNNREGVVAEIAGYAETDLLYYRAEKPEKLVTLQNSAWDPVLARFSERLGADFTLTTGIGHVKQPEDSIKVIKQHIEKTNDFVLAALASLTNLTDSILLPIAFNLGWFDGETIWAAAHVDEDWQISQWGPDEEAEARQVYRRKEMMTACRLIGQLA